MKKIVVIFLVILYTFSFTELKEFSKLPNFIEHYKEHKSHNKNTTLYSFIVLHYLSGNIKDKDYDEDMKLPFKAHDFSCFSIEIQDLPKSFELTTLSETYFFEKKDKNFYYFLNFSEGKSFSFYPPPKFI